MTISFDFDGTLTDPRYFDLAMGFIARGCTVYITTSRHKDKNNDDLYSLAKRLGLPNENIQFTNYNSKLPFVKNYDLHFDDDNVEIDEIRLNGGKCIGVLVDEIKYNYF